MNRKHQITGEQGSATAELVLVTPLLILILVFVVALGRLTSARIEVDSAAAQAARAASMAWSPQSTNQVARQSAAATLSGDHVTCAHLDVSVDTTEFVPGGSVSVTVSCGVDLSQLTGLDLPTTQTISSEAVSPLDRFRSVAG